MDCVWQHRASCSLDIYTLVMMITIRGALLIVTSQVKNKYYVFRSSLVTKMQSKRMDCLYRLTPMNKTNCMRFNCRNEQHHYSWHTYQQCMWNHTALRSLELLVVVHKTSSFFICMKANNFCITTTSLNNVLILCVEEFNFDNLWECILFY